MITSALVSHAMFNAADAIVQRELTQAFFEDVHRELLHQALEQMSRKDPFGYIAGITNARKAIRGWMMSLTQGQVDAQGNLREVMREWHADRLLALSVVMRRGQEDSGGWPEALDDPLAPLDGVLTLDRIAAVAGQSAEIRAAIKAGQVETLSDRDFPSIARIRQQLTRARADLRRTVRVLKHEASSDLASDEG